MSDVKTAIQLAIAFLGELIPEARGIRLEEIEAGESESEWSVTLSYEDEDTLALPRGLVPPKRLYKQFQIDTSAETPVRSMTIRMLERA